MLTKNRIFMAIGAGTSLTITITLPIVFAKNNTAVSNTQEGGIFSNAAKAQYLFGKITSSGSFTFTNKPSFTCSSSNNESCDVKFIDSSKIVLVNDIEKLNFAELDAQSILKKGDYVLIDLKKEYEITDNNATIKSESNSFTFEFQKLKNSNEEIKKQIKNSVSKTIASEKTIVNKTTAHLNSHYAIVKFTNFLSYSNDRNVILKTIEEQKIANGNQTVTQHSNGYRWKNQKNGTLYYELAEIYEIKNQDEVTKKDIDKLDKANNLIQSLEHLETIQKTQWLKMVFSDTTRDLDLQLFDLKYNDDLVIEADIEECWKKTSSSATLVACAKT